MLVLVCGKEGEIETENTFTRHTHTHTHIRTYVERERPVSHERAFSRKYTRSAALAMWKRRDSLLREYPIITSCSTEIRIVSVQSHKITRP